MNVDTGELIRLQQKLLEANGQQRSPEDFIEAQNKKMQIAIVGAPGPATRLPGGDIVIIDPQMIITEFINPPRYEREIAGEAPEPSLFYEVPNELQEEAEQALAGRDRTMVDLQADTGLARWAQGVRKDRNKAKRKQAKNSRKANRR